MTNRSLLVLALSLFYRFVFTTAVGYADGGEFGIAVSSILGGKSMAFSLNRRLVGIRGIIAT
jgi:hypothetical protein